MTATTSAVYPPARDLLAAGGPYPFPTSQGIAPERFNAYAGPNAHEATLAASGYAHPFVWHELVNTWMATEEENREAAHAAHWRAVALVEKAGRYHPELVVTPFAPRGAVPHRPLRSWSGPRASAALAFLVADLLDPADFATMTATWSAVILIPDTITRKDA